MTNIIFVLWFFLPAGVANMTPVFAGHVPGLRTWNYPMDCGLTWRGKRLFGTHKTWRGFVSGVVTGMLTCLLQWYLYEQIPGLKLLVKPYPYTVNPLLLGALLGGGGLLGDAIKSLFKRRVSLKEGSSWFPFDQMDYVIGASFFSSLVYPLSLMRYGIALVAFVVLHVVVSYIGFILHFKSAPI